MITKEIAVTLRHGQELWHNTEINADGSPARCRVNGKCKTWVRYPERFKLPVKHGLKNTFYVTGHQCDGRSRMSQMANAHQWSLPERWAIERHWKEPT